MVHSARQLKDLIRNLAKKNAADAQLLLRSFMMERLLERISLSAYRDKIILKGGMLVASMLGLRARSTMDMDATIRGATVSVTDINRIISEIITVPVDDSVTFCVKQITEIMDEAEYPGIRISLTAIFDGVVTPLKIDFSTGDVITPQEIQYHFKLMLEERSIQILAYNLETVLAEKLETVIRRSTVNTRMRDFYDIHMLRTVYADSIDPTVLMDALRATSTRRGSAAMLRTAPNVCLALRKSDDMQRLWTAYQRKYIYAEAFSWNDILESVELLYGQCLTASLLHSNTVQQENDYDLEF